ncbi:hypothetical protein PENTCL1PPCAC_18555, partial [Pristionchus entomophagus]
IFTSLTVLLVGTDAGIRLFSSNTNMVNYHKSNPVGHFSFIAIESFYIYFMFSKAVMVVISLPLPLFFVLLHASFRMRDGYVNAEPFHGQHTKMGVFLHVFGFNVNE